jgi:predicted nucleotidyltransferase
MDRDEVFAEVRPPEPELRDAGVLAICLFRSTANGSAAFEFELDLGYVLAEDQSASLLDFSDLKRKLANILGTEVDLEEREALHSRTRKPAHSKMVKVF